MDRMTVRAIMERSDWLYGNCPPFKMAIDGLALDEVGLGLWPTWQTSNPDFNKEVTDAFHNSNQDPRIFSLDGRTDFYSSQLQQRVMIRRYGDCFGQFIRAGVGSGYGSSTPGMHMIPGYLCENTGEESGDSGWVRGIYPDKFLRALKYRFLDAEARTHTTTRRSGRALHDPMRRSAGRRSPRYHENVPLRRCETRDGNASFARCSARDRNEAIRPRRRSCCLVRVEEKLRLITK
jgi:hypothetical protein